MSNLLEQTIAAKVLIDDSDEAAINEACEHLRGLHLNNASVIMLALHLLRTAIPTKEETTTKLLHQTCISMLNASITQDTGYTLWTTEK